MYGTVPGGLNQRSAGVSAVTAAPQVPLLNAITEDLAATSHALETVEGELLAMRIRLGIGGQPEAAKEKSDALPAGSIHDLKSVVTAISRKTQAIREHAQALQALF